MKRILTIVVAVVLLIALFGCGSNGNTPNTTATPEKTTAGTQTPVGTTEATQPATEEPTTAAPIETENPEPLDLTGLWVQKDRNDEVWFVATVKESGSIGVFYIFSDRVFYLYSDDTYSAWTYWVGSYQAPETAEETYKWTSKNTYGGNGLYASSEDDKEFTYANGEISFPVTIEGETSTVYLVREDWDTSMIPTNAFTAVKVDPAETAQLEIKDSGWTIVNDKWLYYYVDLYNPNPDTIVEFPTVRITARDSNNLLLGTDDMVLSKIYPKQHFVFGNQAFSVDEIPATVDFEALEPDDYNLEKLTDTNQYAPLEVVNSGMRSDKVVGDITNSNKYNIDTAVVVAIMKDADGNIVSIENGYVDNVKAGGTTPFSISVYGVSGVATVECYANQWS